MARRSIRATSLRAEAPAPDFASLPLTYDFDRQGLTGIYQLAIAALLIVGPAFAFFQDGAPAGEDAWVLALLAAVGVGLVAWGVHNLRRHRRVVVDRQGVSAEVSGLFGTRRWQVPMSSYRGLVLEQVRIHRMKSSYDALAAYLEHPEAAKTVRVFVGAEPDASRDLLRRVAKMLGVQAIDRTGG